MLDLFTTRAAAEERLGELGLDALDCKVVECTLQGVGVAAPL